MELFSKEETKVSLARYRSRMKVLEGADDFEKQRNRLIDLVLSAMTSKPAEWDALCEINSEWIGEKFINALSDSSTEFDKAHLDDVCAMCFRFLFEYYLSIRNELSIEYSSAKNFVFGHVEEFEEHAKLQIEYAIKQMPISIFKELKNSEAIDSIKKFNSVYEKAEKLKADWESEIGDKEFRVNRLKDDLQEYETGFNFVALSHGFEDLAVSKIGEKDNILFWMKVLGFVLLTPIFAQLVFIYTHLGDVSNYLNGLFLSIFPTVTLVGIGIYYFRVLLFNYRSAKLQLLQIELRKTLCRFIQSYSDYASEIKEKDSESLSKFENVIFSGIVSDESELPSTYDGLDQIGKIIASIKN